MKVESKILAGFIVTTVTLGTVGWLSYRATEDFITAQGWVTHTQAVISQLETTLATVIETDTEQRGYLLTGDPQFLQQRQAAAARLAGEFQQIQQLTIDNPTQQQALKQLEELTQREVALADDRIATFQKSGLQAAFTQEPMEKTEAGLNDVRALTAQMRETEETLFAQRQEESSRLGRQTETIIISGSVAAVIIGWIIVIMGRRELKLRVLAQQVQEERDRYFNLSREMICILGFDGYFKTLNPAWKWTLGFSMEELLSRPFIEFIHPDDREATMLEAEKLMKGNELIYFENRYLCKDGSYRWIAWSARAGISQKVIYGTGRDITERKQSVEKIEQLNADLQRHAGQLEAANKELEAFSYSVSHDLRAPLRHIDGFVKMLMKQSGEKLEDRGRRYLDIISDSAQRMGTLIDDLLVFSRMNRTELHHSTVSTEALVHEAVEGLRPECNGRQIRWNINALPEVNADGAMLQQVWVNLISNAVKYTRPKQTAEIEIGCNDWGDGEYVFFVHDNGVGFDMQYVHKLFGVFQRLHRTDEFEGTGIGLANVSRIVHRHGGRVWAEGKLNAGATFYFSLPKKTTETKK
ncbi:MAG TPA: CHASE3 domain-containing protein [Candidatus Acidoferrum sp.]|jgi:PAS domain S-box-containing protein|nr:CHASE3 domain-containing protein [Candidatus Acidoferrum sp.]